MTLNAHIMPSSCAQLGVEWVGRITGLLQYSAAGIRLTRDYVSRPKCVKVVHAYHMAQELDEQLIEEVLGHLRTATDTASGWAKSWHHWGLFNLALLGHHAAAREPAKAQQHVAPAVVGFFRSVALGQMEGEGFVWVPGHFRVFEAVAPAFVGFFRSVALGQMEGAPGVGCWCF